jgi:hypothetical protein
MVQWLTVFSSVLAVLVAVLPTNVLVSFLDTFSSPAPRSITEKKQFQLNMECSKLLYNMKKFDNWYYNETCLTDHPWKQLVIEIEIQEHFVKTTYYSSSTAFSEQIYLAISIL